MSEIRQDPLQGRWVILAPERRNRPDEFARPRRCAPADGVCPFCPGNERETPPEVSALRPAGGAADLPGWTVRVVPNRYPALAPPDGVHELVIESARHDTDLAGMALDETTAALGVWRDRLRALRRRPGIGSVLIFRNQGAEAGATHRHPHAQLLASRDVPPAIAREAERAARHRRESGRCLLCDVLSAELDGGIRVIAGEERFVAFAPFASRVPYELLIAPRRHQGSFADAGDGEIEALARVLGDLLRRLARALDDPPYNLSVHDAPVGPPGTVEFHWHVEVVPRVGTTGGFEWGTDSFINTVTPEEAAAALRDASPGEPARHEPEPGRRHGPIA